MTKPQGNHIGHCDLWLGLCSLLFVTCDLVIDTCYRSLPITASIAAIAAPSR